MNLLKEFEYYLENQNRLVEKYDGKVVVIKNDTLIGVFNSELEAIEKTREQHELGTFLVQRCTPGSDGYTQRFHSRVMFV